MECAMAERSEDSAAKVIHAAKKGLTSEVLRLLRKDETSFIAASDKHGRNCLHLAAIHGHFETTLAILQTNLIDINSTNSKGLTPLHDACLENHSDIVLLLLSFGSHIMARSKDGWTCAMCACSSGHRQLARLLFAAGCDINALSRHDLSALHIAAWKGNIDIVEMLIAEGCRLEQKSKNNKTPLDLARDEGHVECCAVLEAAMGLNSNDVAMKLKVVEGQLKEAQEKLKWGQENFDEILEQEKKHWEHEVATMKEEHQKEVNKLKEEMVALTGQLTKRAQQTKSPISLPSPESPKMKSKQLKGHPGRRPSEIPNKLAAHLNLPPENRLSKSVDNLTEWDNEDNNDESGRGGVNIKMTITQMVEESLKKPESIAVIRKELKEAKLTPKIQRRFGPDTKPPPLKLIESPGSNQTSSSFPLTENLQAHQLNAL